MVESQYFCGFIGILLATFIAPDRYGTFEIRRRRDGICLAKKDSVPKKRIAVVMEHMVLADYQPAVLA